MNPWIKNTLISAFIACILAYSFAGNSAFFTSMLLASFIYSFLYSNAFFMISEYNKNQGYTEFSKRFIYLSSTGILVSFLGYFLTTETGVVPSFTLILYILLGINGFLVPLLLALKLKPEDELKTL